MCTIGLVHRWLRCLVLAVLLIAGFAQAGEIKVESTLIWGTNDEKSPNPQHRPVHPELSQKLARMFKWKNYFQEKRVVQVIPAKAAKRFRMSPKCEIEITELEGPKLEVKLYGEGKWVNTTTKPLKKGEFLTIGGDDKGGNSWFVIITLLEEKGN